MSALGRTRKAPAKNRLHAGCFGALLLGRPLSGRQANALVFFERRGRQASSYDGVIPLT